MIHTSLSLDELEGRLNASPPEELFGKDKKAFIKNVHILCHPDRYIGDPVGLARANAIRKKIEDLAAEAAKPTIVIKSPKGKNYILLRRLAIGDIADIYFGIEGDNEYIIKVSRVAEGHTLMEQEASLLKTILAKSTKFGYDHYFPALRESFEIRDKIKKCVTILNFEPEYSTLESVHALKGSLDPRHLAWIFKRALTALGVIHQCGYVHGAICPAHVMIRPRDHALQLIGFGQSVKIGEKIQKGAGEYVGWYPTEVKKKQPISTSADIYMAAKTIVYLAGGDPETNTLPTAVPREMSVFLKSCLFEGPRMRPFDAWQLEEEFGELLYDIYGPPKFLELTL